MTTSLERAYRVLGLSPGAPPKTVHRAYRDLAQVWHPDRFAHNPRLQEKAQENLRRINDAYELLRDHQPPEQTSSGMYARISETFNAVLGLGDILKTSEIRQVPPEGEREPGHHARPEYPSGRPATTPPPVVGVDAEDGRIDERTSQPVAIWLVLVLSVLLVVAAILLL